MPRSVPLWVGKTDDTPIPARAKIRIYERFGGRCAHCGNKVLPAEYDHIVPLVAGGRNSEDNIQLLCRPCHQAKTAEDVAEKSKVARIKAKHIGADRKKGRPMPGTKASGLRKRMDGTVERRT